MWKDWALRDARGGKVRGKRSVGGWGCMGGICGDLRMVGRFDGWLGDEGEEMEGETKEGVKGRVYGKERRKGRGRA